MDYILGILTGIGLAMFAGYYLNQKEKKRKKDDEHNRAVMKNVIAAFDEMSRFQGFVKPPYPVMNLEEALQDAIARDDFEEAARLRDLMNKK